MLQRSAERRAFEEEIPGGRTRAEQLALADRYREVAGAAYPWYVDELGGIAEGSGTDPRALFAAMVEGIWYEPHAARSCTADAPTSSPSPLRRPASGSWSRTTTTYPGRMRIVFGRGNPCDSIAHEYVFAPDDLAGAGT